MAAVSVGEPAACIMCHKEEQSTASDGHKFFGGRGCEAVVCGPCTQKLIHKTRDIPWDCDFKELKEKQASKYKRLG